MAGHISTRQRQYIRKHTKPHELDPSEQVGELNIVPLLDVLINTIVFLIMASTALAFFSQIEAQLPKYGKGRGSRGAKDEPTLNLSVTITDNGVIVTGSGDKLAPGCETTTGGRVVTVPKTGNGFDWPGLTECVSRIKKKFPDETQVIVSADPLIEYIDVVGAMDSLRKEKGWRGFVS